MADIFPGVTTRQEAYGAGVGKRAHYLFTQLHSGAEREAFLQRMFPGMAAAEVRGLLRGLGRTWERLPQFQAGGRHPLLSAVPVDPTHAQRGRFAYTLRVRYDETVTGPGAQAMVHRRAHVMTVYTDAPATAAELQREAEQFIMANATRWAEQYRGRYQAGVMVAGADIISITRAW